MGFQAVKTVCQLHNCGKYRLFFTPNWYGASVGRRSAIVSCRFSTTLCSRMVTLAGWIEPSLTRLESRHSSISTVRTSSLILPQRKHLNQQQQQQQQQQQVTSTVRRRRGQSGNFFLQLDHAMLWNVVTGIYKLNWVASACTPVVATSS